MQFIAYGAVTDAIDKSTADPSAVARSAASTPAQAGSMIPDEIVRPHPGLRPGAIDIGLTSGVRLSVDAYVN